MKNIFNPFKPIKEYHLLNNQVDYEKYLNSYIINVNGNTQSHIEQAYNNAISMPKSELLGYDSIVIDLGGKEYFIESGIELTNKSENELPVIFTSGKINGGITFSGDFEAVKNGIYRRKLTTKKFRQLYVNEKLAIRSRFPKKNDDYNKEVIFGQWLKNTDTLTASHSVEKYINNENINDIEIHLIEAWTHSIAKINGFDKNGEDLIFKFTDVCKKAFSKQRSSKIKKPKMWLENALSLLNSPNEWFYDSKNECLYYYPENENDVNKLIFTAPQSENLITIKNADNIRFENVEFMFSNWTYANDNGFVDGQATSNYTKENGFTSWNSPPASIEIQNSNKIQFINCTVAKIGSTAIKYDCNCNDILLHYNDFYDIAGGAIIISSFSDCIDKLLPISKNVCITDNVIDRIGTGFFGGVGIMVGYAENVVIDHNEVSNGSYTGISVGWGWGAKTNMNNYQITNNKVYKIIENHLYDGSGLYILGRFKDGNTNVVSGNYLEGGHGYAGLYFDEKSNNYIAENNVIKKGSMGFLLMHDLDYGLKNISVQNNFIETNKKKINSYKMDKSAKKALLSKRNVIVKNNYLPKNINFENECEKILDNCGRR